MITKLYECTCDYCGNVIKHFMYLRPTKEDFIKLGAVVHGKKIFCDERCYADYNHDANIRRAQNLKQIREGKTTKRY